VKLGVKVLHLPSLMNYGFGDSRYCGSYTLRKGINAVVLFSTFFFRFFFWGGGLVQEMSTDIYRVSASLIKIGSMTATLYLWASMNSARNSHIYPPGLVEFS
jgi:hypothetical protein